MYIRILPMDYRKLLKIDNKIGSIKEGLNADLVLFDEDINIKRVIINGKIML